MPVTQQPPIRHATLPFGDARGCREWLGALPLTNIPQAQAMVLDAVKQLTAAEAEPLERLKCLELVREKVAFLQGEQRARWFGKSLPLSANDSDAWRTGRSLLEEMETGYRAAVAASAGGSGEIATHRALAVERVMRYVGGQMLAHALVYRRFDQQLWTRLHNDYREAEAAGISEVIVKDSLESDDGTSSIAEAYAQIVVLQAAYLSEMTAPQIEFAMKLLRIWARKVVVRAKPLEGGAPNLPLTVDFDRPIGARPLAAADLRANHRVIDVTELSKSMRRRIQALQQDQDPATLGLPADIPPGDAFEHLKRLHKLWCEGAPPRPPAKVPAEKSVGIVFGLNEIHFYVTGGKPFEQPDKKRELTRQEKQDLEVFGRVTERTQSMMVSDFSSALESWGVIDEMMGAWRLQRPPTSSRGVVIGRLVAMRIGDGTPFFLGRVSALAQETDGRLIATVSLFMGKPAAVPVRAADARNRANAQWGVGFRLPGLEKVRIAPSVVVPSNMAQRGRGIELWENGAGKETTVEDVLDRGTDFDRIATF